jgi:hypothetical protein
MGGKIVAVAVFSAFVALVAFGIACDVRRSLLSRHNRRLMAEIGLKEILADQEALAQQHLRASADSMREELDWLDRMAAQLEELQQLPTFEPSA